VGHQGGLRGNNIAIPGEQRLKGPPAMDPAHPLLIRCISAKVRPNVRNQEQCS